MAYYMLFTSVSTTQTYGYILFNHSVLVHFKQINSMQQNFRKKYSVPLKDLYVAERTPYITFLCSDPNFLI